MKRITSLAIGCSVAILAFSNPNYYSWDRQTLNTSAPSAYDPGLQYGDGNVYYTNPSSLITRAYPSGSSWLYENITGIDPVKYGSVFTYGDWKLYYVGTDNKVHNLYKAGSTWVTPVMQPAATTARGDALLFTENSTLFYASTGNTICKLQWNGSSWAFTNFSTVFVKPNTSFAYGDSKLYFVDNLSMVRNLVPNGSGGWYDGGVMCAAAPPARGDGMTFGAPGELFYIDINDRITRLYWTGSSWQYETITQAPLCIWNSFTPNLVYDQGRLFYTANTSLPTVLLKDVCKWYTKTICTNGNTAAPYRMTFGGGKLFCMYASQVCSFAPAIDNSNYPYVYIKGRTFYVNNNTPMYPKVMNYLVNFYTDDNVNYWVAPHHSFSPNNQRPANNQAQGSAALATHFAQIAAMGCNSIRVMGLGVAENTSNTSDYRPHAMTLYTTNLIPVQQAADAAFQAKMFPLIKEVVDVANANGLKVIFCTGQGALVYPSYQQDYLSYLSALAAYNGLKTNTGLLAYDVFNEPALNFGFSDKQQICNLSADMFLSIRNNDPNHLITIGTFGGDDVARWDPAILSCDFYSFHFYPYTTYTDVSFQSELAKMYWAKENIVDRPWIIGETGFTAEEKYMPFGSYPGQDLCNNWPYGVSGWGNENTQKNYAISTQNWTRGCGGSGYSWWAYHDVYHLPTSHPSYAENFFGVVSNCDRPKAAAGEFNKDFLNASQYPCDNAVKPSDYYYYNADPSQCYVMTGTLLDSWGNPIKDGLVGSWNSGWGQYRSTYTKADGTFALYTPYPVGIVIFTGMGKAVPSAFFSNPGANYTGTGCSMVFAYGNQTVPNLSPCTGPFGRMAGEEPATPAVTETVVNAFPNPTAGSFTVQVSNEDEYTVSVFSVMGQNVKQVTFTGSKTEIDLMDQPVGMYLVEVKNAAGTVREIIRMIRN